jgi:hypothetical protein
LSTGLVFWELAFTQMIPAVGKLTDYSSNSNTPFSYPIVHTNSNCTIGPD